MTRIARATLALFVVACATGQEATAPQERLSITALSSTDMAGVVGAPAPETPTIRVTDRAGKPVANVDVSFDIDNHFGESNAWVDRRHVLTNSAGIASGGEWTLNTSPGENLLRVSVAEGRTVIFRAVAKADAPFALGWDEETEDQFAFPQMTVRPPKLQVRDRFGNSLAGIAVTFTVIAGNGTIAISRAVTSKEGAYAFAWTLGAGLEANTLRASALTLPSIDYTFVVEPPIAFYDLAMINDGEPSDYAIKDSFIGFTANQRFVILTSLVFTEERAGYLESGHYELNGTKLALIYAGGHREEASLLNGTLLFDRRNDDGYRETWKYAIRR